MTGEEVGSVQSQVSLMTSRHSCSTRWINGRSVIVLAAVALMFAAMLELAAAPRSDGPKVTVDLSKMKGLTYSPLPKYPKEARQHSWGGLGIFELHFKGDGTVSGVLVLLSTDHKLLDEAAKAAVTQWRCKPGSPRVAMVTVFFQTGAQSQAANSITDMDGERKRGNLTYAPRPYYPLEARLNHWGGAGIFVLHFKPNGTVSSVIALKSTGHQVLDDECGATFFQWRCRPGAYTVIEVPIHFTVE